MYLGVLVKFFVFCEFLLFPQKVYHNFGFYHHGQRQIANINKQNSSIYLFYGALRFCRRFISVILLQVPNITFNFFHELRGDGHISNDLRLFVYQNENSF